MIDSCWGASPTFVEKEASQLASVGEGDSTLPDLRWVAREILDEAGQPRIAFCRFHNPSVFCSLSASAPPKVTLPTRKHPGPNRTLSSRGRRVLVQDILPTAAHHAVVVVSEFERYLRVMDIEGTENFVSHSLNDIQNADLCAVRLSLRHGRGCVQTCSLHTSSSLMG